MDAHFVAGDLGLVLQGFDLLPVQDDLGVGRVPHHFDGRLTRCCKDRHSSHYSPGTGGDQVRGQSQWILAWLFGGDVDGGAGRPRSRRVVRPH